MHKCDSVQFLFRQHESLFAASREFCGRLTACLFVVVFRLAVKIFGGFTATSAKIRLGGSGGLHELNSTDFQFANSSSVHFSLYVLWTSGYVHRERKCAENYNTINLRF